MAFRRKPSPQGSETDRARDRIASEQDKKRFLEDKRDERDKGGDHRGRGRHKKKG